MAKIEHVIGVLILTQCLFLLIYGQQTTQKPPVGKFINARRDALKWLALPQNRGKRPKLIKGMITHGGKGNTAKNKETTFPYKLDPAPRG